MAFPKLSEEQIAQLGHYAGASTKTFRAGEPLFRAGDREPKFYVIKSGELEIIDVTGDQPKTIRVQGPGDFTGDVGHLTGSPKVVSAIARSDGEVYEMSEGELRKVLNQDPQLSDLILQAFIARRQLMRESPVFTGLRVIGSPSLPARIVWSCAIHRIANWLKRSVFAVRSSTTFMIWPSLVRGRRDWRQRFTAHPKD